MWMTVGIDDYLFGFICGELIIVCMNLVIGKLSMGYSVSGRVFDLIITKWWLPGKIFDDFLEVFFDTIFMF